jgi:hypothetical protein
MKVRNIHERHFAARVEQVGALLDDLASPGDRLWPSAKWPAIRFDRPLKVGASGGHGPIRYVVEVYEPGKCLRLRIRSPRGFDGYHAFEVESTANGATLRHILEMTPRGTALLTWPLIFRPLHDALLEDCLDNAALALNEAPRDRRWSFIVRLLRAGARVAGRAFQRRT